MFRTLFLAVAIILLILPGGCSNVTITGETNESVQANMNEPGTIPGSFV